MSTPNLTGEERRADKRIPLLLEAYWESPSGGKQLLRLGDISASGCFLNSAIQPDIGSIIDLEIRLPAGRWIAVQCKVMHQQPDKGFGVRFESTSAQEQVLLAELIDFIILKQME